MYFEKLLLIGLRDNVDEPSAKCFLKFGGVKCHRSVSPEYRRDVNWKLCTGLAPLLVALTIYLDTALEFVSMNDRDSTRVFPGK